MQALAQAPQRCGLVNHGMLKNRQKIAQNWIFCDFKADLRWYDFLALGALKSTQNVANPKNFGSAEISARFWAKSNFGPQKSQKIDFFKLCWALYLRQNTFEKKRLGRLKLLHPKQNGLFWGFEMLIAKLH